MTYRASKKGIFYPENIIDTTLKNLKAKAIENKIKPPHKRTDAKFLLFSSSAKTIFQYLPIQKIQPKNITAYGQSIIPYSSMLMPLLFKSKSKEISTSLPK